MDHRILFLIAAAVLCAGPASAAADGDTCLMLAADNIARGGGNDYAYFLFSREAVTLAPGDVLEYEIFLLEDLPEAKGGVDVWFRDDRTPLRDVTVRERKIADQNGINAHGDGILQPALGRWYRRSIPLDAAAGCTASGWYIVSEGDREGCYVQFVDNVRVLRADGSTVAVYTDGAPPEREAVLLNGYSKYSTLEVVERALPGGPPAAVRGTIDRITANGRRLARLDDLRHETKMVRAVLARAGQDLPAGLEGGIAALEEAVEDPERFAELLARAEEALAPARPLVKTHRAHLVGHAHIDYQWLWDWPQTVEVCRETFAQALRFMDEFEDFTFTQSSSGLYAAVEESFPELFEEIRRAAASGRWEIAGGRVCEADEHMISSESHARQFLYGQRYFCERFGRRAAVGWEPDTFGHTAQMPQILTLGGCDSVYFCRGGVNTPLFWWEALDGTRVLAFEEQATGTWYNAGIGRAQIDEHAAFLERYGSTDSLWVYGVGNHGGGPTREHIETALDLRAKPFTPDVAFSTAAAFFGALREKVDLDAIPVERGELNSRVQAGFFGTYTSHGDVKRWNRDAEAAAETAEALALAASFHGFAYPKAAFRRIWEAICWNHHHDTLCGTSIHSAYAKSRAVYERAAAECGDIGLAALESIAGRVPPGPPRTLGAIPPPGEYQKIIVFNPLCWERDGLVVFDVLKRTGRAQSLAAVDPGGRAVPVQELGGAAGRKGIFMAEDLPSLGYRTYTIVVAGEKPDNPLRAELPGEGEGPAVLENAGVRVEIDPASGLVTGLVHRKTGRDLVADGGSIGLDVLFEKPHGMSAWVIGEFLPEHERIAVRSITVEEAGPVRAVVRIDGAFGDSTVTQRLSLARGSDVVDVELAVDWREHSLGRRGPAPFLKLTAQTALADPEAFYEVPFGAVARPADGTEVPALKWADLSAGDLGLSILNDCRHGYAAAGGDLSLSLIRTPASPDPVSDVGAHLIGCALYPHAGTWREAETVRRAAEFNKPLLAINVPFNSRGTLPDELAYFSIDSGAIVATGLKRAEDGGGVIVRCYESSGGPARLDLACPRPVESTELVDFVEDALRPAGVEDGRIREELPPWRIATYRIKLEEK